MGSEMCIRDRFWYDLIKTARKLIRHSHAAVSAEDLCYWIAAALYLFVRIYGENSGILRGYLFGGILGGAALYHASFGRFLPELLAKGIILKDTREGVKWKRA